MRTKDGETKSGQRSRQKKEIKKDRKKNSPQSATSWRCCIIVRVQMRLNFPWNVPRQLSRPRSSVCALREPRAASTRRAHLCSRARIHARRNAIIMLMMLSTFFFFFLRQYLVTNFWHFNWVPGFHTVFWHIRHLLTIKGSIYLNPL